MKLILLLACLQEDPAAALQHGWTHPWAGFAAGSRVVYTARRPVLVIETRNLDVAEVTKDGPMIWMSQGDRKMKEPLLFQTRPPSELTSDVERAGKETIKIGEKSYDCAIFKSRYTISDLEFVSLFWKAADAPCWVVKQSYTMRRGTEVRHAWTEEYAGTEKIKIGERELGCEIYQRSILGKAPRLETEWRCKEVPGGLVKAVKFATDAKGNEVKGTRYEDLLTEFVKK